MTPAESLTAKGRQTRESIELAARTLFAERGFHGTTLADITSAAGKSSAVFYRYFDDKEDLLASLAESVRHAADEGYARDLNPEHIAAAIALLFENFTVVVVGSPGSELQISDEDAIKTLSTIWQKTLYGF
jgi:AcrR family transcriptional regulator